MKYDIDWTATRPDQAAFDDGWRDTAITTVASPGAAIANIEHSLASSHTNGGARLAQFRISAATSVAWAMSRNRFGEFNFFERFFNHPVVLAAVPEATGAKPLAGVFGMEETFASFGRVAGALARGGADEQFAGTDEEAWALTTRLMQTAVGFRIRECSAWVSWCAWSPWFRDVAWDATFFWFDPDTGTATVLLITDTD